MLLERVLQVFVIDYHAFDRLLHAVGYRDANKNLGYQILSKIDS